MTKREMVRLLKSDDKEWNRWRNADLNAYLDLRGVKLSGIDLRWRWIGKADLHGADFSGTDLTGVNLWKANLTSTNLCDAWLDSADLFGANLSNADLTCANFTGTSLIGADLRGAKLESATFTATEFSDADFTSALLESTTFNTVDSSRAKGLDFVVHIGPSHLDIDTIYLSGGKIPESFLLGTGVPESFIPFISSLVGAQEGIQFYSCFISYSHKDEDFARRLHASMRAANLRVWYAPEEMRGGQKLHEQIETAIRVYDKLLVVLSNASLQSEWVKTEIRNARRAEEKTGKRKLFSVRLVDMATIREWSEFDADSGKDIGVELREYFIPDFSEWKDHDKFEAAFIRLLRDLKADAGPSTTASGA